MPNFWQPAIRLILKIQSFPLGMLIRQRSSQFFNFSIFLNRLSLKSKVPWIQKKIMYGKFLLHNECRRSLSKFKSGSFFCNKCNFVAQVMSFGSQHSVSKSTISPRNHEPFQRTNLIWFSKFHGFLSTS